MSESSHNLNRVIRGIPLWLIRDYLVELGGHEDTPGMIAGNGWKASLTQMEDFQIGSVRVGQVQLSLTASGETFENIRATLEKKFLRAGG